MTENANVGYEIKIARTLHKLRQQTVAEQVGIAVPYLSGIENGKYVPSDRLLRDLRKVVGWTQAIADLVASTAELSIEKEN